jgi:hypothetical protein
MSRSADPAPRWVGMLANTGEEGLTGFRLLCSDLSIVDGNVVVGPADVHPSGIGGWDMFTAIESTCPESHVATGYYGDHGDFQLYRLGLRCARPTLMP